MEFLFDFEVQRVDEGLALTVIVSHKDRELAVPVGVFSNLVQARRAFVDFQREFMEDFHEYCRLRQLAVIERVKEVKKDAKKRKK